MRFLSTKIHGIIDYVMSFIVLGSPWIFGFADAGAAQWMPVVVGGFGLAYSACTNYEFGLIKSLSMRTHLALDMLSGTLLALSPWLFGFSEYVYLPHLVLGVLEIGAALVTNPVPVDRTHPNGEPNVNPEKTRTAH